MIAEPGVLSTSPWNSDFLLKDCPSDSIKSYLNTNNGFDFGFPLLDVESRSGRWNLQQDFSSSCSPSSTSSECSEELSDFILQSNDVVMHVPEHDLNVCLKNLLDDDGMDVCRSDFDWAAGESLISSESFFSEDTGSVEMLTIPSLSAPKQKRSDLVDPVVDNKLWSRMALNEQFEVIENLTNIISTKMGLREQLDIIRIIEPNAVVSPTDTEFVIDLSSLNDVKLCGVREYLRKVLANKEESQDHKRSTGKSGSNSTSTKCKSSTSGKSNAGTTTAKSKGGKQKEVKDKQTPQKVCRQRMRKEHRQQMKERRSGLFVREEILSLSTCPRVEEETDIDVLG